MALEQLFRRQLAFTGKVIKTLDGADLRSLDDAAKTRWTKEYILSLMSELTEILGCLNWKHHRTLDSGPRIDLVEEIVDVQKFIWGLAQIWGVSLEELESEFNRKSDVVEQRWRQEHELPAILQAARVAMVDIDGVLSDYPRYFIDWALESHPGLDREQVDKTANPVLWERLKHEYRLSGAKRRAYVKEGARDGLELLHKLGYAILLFSNRPVKQYSRIVADTVEWLKNNRLDYDYIYWANLEKTTDMLDRFPMVEVAFDDDPSTVTTMRQAGINAYRIAEDDWPTLLLAVCEESERRAPVVS